MSLLMDHITSRNAKTQCILSMPNMLKFQVTFSWVHLEYPIPDRALPVVPFFSLLIQRCFLCFQMDFKYLGFAFAYKCRWIMHIELWFWYSNTCQSKIFLSQILIYVHILPDSYRKNILLTCLTGIFHVHWYVHWCS